MQRKAPIGKALRRLRQQNDWTLAEVSRRTGLAISTLSKVENDRMSLTFDKIASLCEGLEIDIGTLFAGGPALDAAAPAMTRRSIDRGDDGSLVDTQNYRHRYLNTDIARKKMVPILVEHKARSMEEFGPLVRHAGEEFLYVLEGAIELHTEHYAPTLLKAGDCAYIDSTMGHAYLAAADGPCRTLSVCTAPESQIRHLMPPEPASSGKS